MNINDVLEADELVKDILDINKQLKSNIPDKNELVKIAKKGKVKFISRTIEYETIKSMQPNAQSMPFENMDIAELLSRAKYYLLLYIDELTKKYGKDISSQFLTKYNINL